MTRSALRIVVVYVVALAASHAVRWISPSAEEGPLPPRGKRVAIAETDRGKSTGRTIQVAYLEWDEGGEDAPVVLMLHGSPGDASTFNRIAPLMASSCRIIVPDLPGFRKSTNDIADYSTQRLSSE